MPPTSRPANAPPRWALEDFGVGSGDPQMEKTQQEIRCSICEKSVTPRQEFYVDEHGKAMHADCYVRRSSQGNGCISGTAA